MTTKKKVKKKRRKIAEKNRGTVKKMLADWGMYCTFTKECLISLEERNPGYDSYYVELDEAAEGCGCWHSCDCNTTKAFLYGVRKETDDEYYLRVDKQKAKDKTAKSAREAADRKTWERLNKRFADDEQ